MPPRYRPTFRGLQRDLQTHLGYDFGALRMARDLAAAFKAPLVASTVTRLVVDLNRSIGHPRLYGTPVARPAAPRTRRILVEHYLPYRDRRRTADRRERSLADDACFMSPLTASLPALNGKRSARPMSVSCTIPRAPARSASPPPGRPPSTHASPGSAFAATIRTRARRRFHAVLRTRFRPRAYVGIEIEVNQAIVIGARPRWAALRSALIDSLRSHSPHREGHANPRRM